MRRLISMACPVLAVLLVIVWNFPISNFATRWATLTLLAGVWITFLVVVWPRRIFRYGVLALTASVGAFVFFPSHRMPPPETLRRAYVTALERYTGTRYVWGGESWTGIDCSGLIRRAMIDALVGTGVRVSAPEAVRQGIRLWWQDTTADSLGNGDRGTTRPVRLISSIRKEPSKAISPGDLAITKSGIHILAYLGEGRWIDADPGAGKVRTSTLTSPDNAWMDDPMRLARWNFFEN